MHSRIRLGFPYALLAIIASPVMAQGSPDPTADSVAALIAAYDRAWNGRDAATVDRLLAPDYQYFTSIGGLTSREETLRFLTLPDYRLEHADRSEIAVRVSGPVAVASSRWRGHGTYRGRRFTDDQRCGQVWLRGGAGAGWHLLSEHCTQIAAAPASP